MTTTAVPCIVPGTPFFCSWSGGKDCCLALELSAEAGAWPAALFTVMDETGARSHSHGLTLASLQVQADALGLPLVSDAVTAHDGSHFLAVGLERP